MPRRPVGCAFSARRSFLALPCSCCPADAVRRGHATGGPLPCRSSLDCVPETGKE